MLRFSPYHAYLDLFVSYYHVQRTPKVAGANAEAVAAVARITATTFMVIWKDGGVRQAKASGVEAAGSSSPPGSGGVSRSQELVHDVLVADTSSEPRVSFLGALSDSDQLTSDDVRMVR